MTVWRVGSKAATAGRAATVLPAPTSPVTTLRARSPTSQVMRATASAWVRWRWEHLGREVTPEGGAAEAVVGAQALDHQVGSLGLPVAVVAGWLGGGAEAGRIGGAEACRVGGVVVGLEVGQGQLGVGDRAAGLGGELGLDH